MYLNEFSVRIPEGNEKSGGYVEIDHGQRYTLVLRNARSVRCDARVTIDGNEIGEFRISANGTIRLERGLDNDGYLTAAIPDSVEGQLGGLDNANPDLGLISVVFTPEVDWRPTGQVKGIEQPVYRSALSSNPAMASFGEPRSKGLDRSIGTVATGHSNQQFREVGRLVYDYDQRTTINLRLVRRQDYVRPLTQRQNPVPPRIY